MKKQLAVPLLVMCTFSVLTAQIKTGKIGYSPETLQSLAHQFMTPSDVYKPYAWWHWLGSNFSKEGMTKDLRAMKDAGIEGVIIFNAPSWLNTKQNPWPEQTYRSTAYWDAFKHSLNEARKLNMKVGLHNSPGWSVTGGPWISPEEGMQAVAFSKTRIRGEKEVRVELPNPKEGTEVAGYFKDVAVMAVPVGKKILSSDVLDISEHFANGLLDWQVPPGEWAVYRFGHYPTMVRSHPAPEDVADYSFEVDKMDPEATIKHWNGVLAPLKDQFSEYIGNTFNYIWIDSYEAGEQNWSPNFRSDFIRMKGYDPVPQIILAYERGDSILDFDTHGIRTLEGKPVTESELFLKDYAEVINRLYQDCWRLGKEMVNNAGFLLCWEPYSSWRGARFDMAEGVAIPDIPVTEFWVHDESIIGDETMAEAAAKNNKRIIGAEAFTGMEATCTFTETPAMLKRSADMGFSFGANLYFLHSWAHNPFSDELQPGWSFAHYGTHFSRNLTWLKPGKAFFTYLTRCQMLLQQGSFISRNDSVLHRSTPEAEMFFIRNQENQGMKTYEFPITGRVPELWDAYRGTISETNRWTQENERTKVVLTLGKDESVFVVFPRQKTCYEKRPEIDILKETPISVDGKWIVTFYPKTGEEPFEEEFTGLVDFSTQEKEAVRYFSGTAVYEKMIDIKASDLRNNKRIVLDLGQLYDLAKLEINGKDAGVLWLPPFRTEIGPFLKAGRNVLKIAVTNTWVNRLIGDEQYPEDFEWTDKNQGLRAMTGLPEWFVKGEPRPVKERKAFIPWFYFNKDSPLLPAGLLGPVVIYYQDILSVYDLRCEYMKEPLGIDDPYCREQSLHFNGFSPRLSWKITDKDGQGKQTAYRVVVSDVREDILQNERGIWDSGIVKENNQFCFIPDSLIASSTDYYWKVGIYNKDSLSCVWSEPAHFSTGLLKEDWKGTWITHPTASKESHVWFRKNFTLPKEISGNIYAYIASLGYHELYVNGEKADDRVLAPAVSRLDKRVLYVTYDISKLVRKGDNVIAINYGPGWSMNNYFASGPGPGILVQVYGNEKHFSLFSDSTWVCSESYSRNAGRFDFMDMGGELVDGRKYTKQWKDSDFDDSRWKKASEKQQFNEPVLSSQMTEPSRIIDTIPAKILSEIIVPSERDSSREIIYRVDMGKEFTGFLEAGFEKLNKGDTVEIMISMRDTVPELVQATYGIGNKVIEEQRQKQIYIARGEAGETFRNRFNFFGGRYIHFKGLREAPKLQHIKGLAISSAPEVTASFECSDSLYNRLFELDRYTYQMCHTEGVVVDCPNRERLGYGPEGAYQTMWGLGLPCFNSSAYYIKNVRDWADVQSEDGYINNVAPQISAMYGCVLNGTAILNTAWEHFRIYGDKRILEMAYPVGQKWLDFLNNYVKEDMLTRYASHGYFLGDWVSPGPVFEYAETEEALFFNNCAYVMTLELILRMAEVLQKDEEEIEVNTKKLQALRQALHRTYYDPETGSYQNGDQVRTSFALYTGIVPDELKESVRKYLNDLLVREGFLNVGSFGRYPFYKTVLDEPESIQIMDGILQKTTYPGYGYFIENGCTTLPEMWEIDCPNSTVIHTSYTGISAFFFKSLAGIKELSAGCDTILIAPCPVERLSWCKAAMETPLGRVESAWIKKENGCVEYTFSIPFGMTAKIRLGDEEKLVSGGRTYCFESVK